MDKDMNMDVTMADLLERGYDKEDKNPEDDAEL
jgi:hypothetical protein